MTRLEAIREQHKAVDDCAGWAWTPIGTDAHKHRGELLAMADEAQAKLEAAEAKLEAVGRLPVKWRNQCGNRVTKINKLKMECANELQSILEDK